MTLFRNVVFIAAIAGLVAGVVLACMQAYATVPLILKAEVFENAGGGHHHDHAAHRQQCRSGYQCHEHGRPAADAMSMAPAEAARTGGRRRLGAGRRLRAFRLRRVANIVTGIGFALILVAVSEFAGGIGNWRQGVFWGLAGFAVFTLAPGLGLPPELPAMPAADLASARSGGGQRLRPPRPVSA